MKEYCEFRVQEEHAHLLFNKTEGVALSDTVRKITIPTSDTRYAQIGVINARLRQENRNPFFLGWKIIRKYSKSEEESAEIFHLSPFASSAPTAEDCGTKFDYSKSCPVCGTGSIRIGPVRLNLRTLSRKDISITFAGELIVSKKFVDFFRRNKFKGLKFENLQSKRKSSSRSEYYFALVTSKPLHISPSTIVGVNPFDFSTESPGVSDIEKLRRLIPEQLIADVKTFFSRKETYRCPYGHTIGLNLLSEPFINKTKLQGRDFFSTAEMIGVSRGSLRPQSLYIVTKRFWKTFKSSKLTGADFQLAYFR